MSVRASLRGARFFQLASLTHAEQRSLHHQSVSDNFAALPRNVSLSEDSSLLYLTRLNEDEQQLPRAPNERRNTWLLLRRDVRHLPKERRLRQHRQHRQHRQPAPRRPG
jgi:hypothetical protein